MQIRTVLCPLDLSPLSETELAMGMEVAGAFGARLILHHNHDMVTPGLARIWQWEAEHRSDTVPPREVERRMHDFLQRVPAELRPEAVVTSGPTERILQSIAEDLPVDLVVMGSHGWSTPSHPSLTERVIDYPPCPILGFDESAGPPRAFHLRPNGDVDAPLPLVVVSTDGSPGGRHAVDYAFGLARRLPLRLELLRVLSAWEARSSDGRRAAQAALDAHVPADLRERVTTRLRTGRADREIVDHLHEVRPSFVVVGEHAPGLVRHLLTRDTTRAIVHRAPCPVWVVPTCAAA